jgi:hypothetical protein
LERKNKKEVDFIRLSKPITSNLASGKHLRPNSYLLASANFASGGAQLGEHCVEGATQGGDTSDRDNGDQANEQTVFEHGGSAFITYEAGNQVADNKSSGHNKNPFSN